MYWIKINTESNDYVRVVVLGFSFIQILQIYYSTIGGISPECVELCVCVCVRVLSCDVLFHFSNPWIS